MTSLKILAASVLFTAAPALAADCCEERAECCERGDCCDKRDHRHEAERKDAPKK
ncbi:hypothetical protein [Sphingomonas lenta]|uniref:hypothetical protein n=1 Tax=Sphingomonas lenta TaxID=1141887 RepID=UPI001595467C|nr:hypothetical protein [Sphingomonas lenta]